MKKLKFIIAALLIPVIFIACDESGSSGDNSGSSSYTMKALPSKYMVDIPDSISSTVTSAKIVSKSMLQSELKAVSASSGSNMLRSMTGMMKSMSGLVGFYIILTDAAIEQNGIQADETPHECTITLTRAMVDSIAAIFPMNTADNAGLESFIGSSISVTLTYNDNGTDTYKYSATILVDDTPLTVYWSEDKKNTKIEMPLIGEGDITVTGNMIFSYNDTEKIMTMSFLMNFGGSAYKMDMSLKEQGNGALFISNIEYLGTICRIEGYADNNGGYIKYTIISSTFGSFTYTENFDANGNTIVGDGSYESVYTNARSNGDISDLQSNTGFSITTTLADGEYIVVKDGALTNSNVLNDKSKIVGVGIVSSGKLVIQDIGGGAYSYLDTKPGTVYLFKSDGAFVGNAAPVFLADKYTVNF